MSLNKDMGDAHEAYVNDVLKMRGTRGSGNQWRDPMDGRHNRLDVRFPFANDSKSTLKKSISVTLAMWEKAKLQAGGERPMLTLRYYADASLSRVHADLAVVDLLDLAEMREAAEKWEEIKPILKKIIKADPRCIRVLVASIGHVLKEDGR